VIRRLTETGWLEQMRSVAEFEKEEEEEERRRNSGSGCGCGCGCSPGLSYPILSYPDFVWYRSVLLKRELKVKGTVELLWLVCRSPEGLMVGWSD
jgi:hypothetical protein